MWQRATDDDAVDTATYEFRRYRVVYRLCCCAHDEVVGRPPPAIRRRPSVVNAYLNIYVVADVIMSAHGCANAIVVTSADAHGNTYAHTHGSCSALTCSNAYAVIISVGG